ncbi:Uncharacterized protein EbC_25990 [Erwinia billingiae Eb661]|uniref:Chaperone protein Skp n=1 Tax=Erwinia billingiae (strain Eb661) TaxID=634500 RepID=D8MTH3_ERWBE|nr:hypothetical protein [Erwinia billingiae]CAX60130.1 Uncharacterized protein EbC_25990 [Erwinia billingiae Eb661]
MKSGSLLLLLTALTGGLLLSGCNDKGNEKVTMRFVNMDKVLQETGFAAQQASHLQAVRESLMAGEAKASESYAGMDEEKRQKASLADRQLLAVQWQAEKQAAHQRVTGMVKQASDSWMKEHGVSAIMPLSSAVAVSPEADVTEAIVASLKGKTVSFGTVPEITLKQDEKSKS